MVTLQMLFHITQFKWLIYVWYGIKRLVYVIWATIWTIGNHVYWFKLTDVPLECLWRHIDPANYRFQLLI